MKITGYRSLHDRSRLGAAHRRRQRRACPAPRHRVHVLILETDSGVEGVGLGAHGDIDRVFPRRRGRGPASRRRPVRPDARLGVQGRPLGRDVRHDRRDRHGALGPQGEGRGRAALAHARRPRPLRPRLRVRARVSHSTTTSWCALYERVRRPRLQRRQAQGRPRPRPRPARGWRSCGTCSPQLAHPALMFDANESWNRAQAVRYRRRPSRSARRPHLGRGAGAPLGCRRAWPRCAASIRAGVATGENLTGLEQYRPLLDADAIDIVQVGNVWGITHFLRVATLAHGHDLPVSPVAYNANPVAHAAAAVPNLLAYRGAGPPLPGRAGCRPGVRRRRHRARRPPGLGIVVDESQIDAGRRVPTCRRPRPAPTSDPSARHCASSPSPTSSTTRPCR